MLLPQLTHLLLQRLPLPVKCRLLLLVLLGECCVLLLLLGECCLLLLLGECCLLLLLLLCICISC
tara:strand:+ start:3719 stop:3913 length:195 start_codon:yes stop_codon:yes gene_type:complete